MRFWFIAVALVASACLGTPTPPAADVKVALALVASGFDAPVHVVEAGDGSGRLFVVEQEGVVRIVKGGTRVEGAFLDLRSLVSNGGERGLLSVAFEPDYEESGRFYASYTDNDGDSVLARYEVDPPEADRANDASAVRVLGQDQPYSNHNGGLAAFGPDGYLYVGFGDGGSGGDPHGYGQDASTWLGKLLRIDVVGEATYRVPDDNPKKAGWRPEIWAYGLRNPWRFSFDRATGDLWIADVGQGSREEIDFQSVASRGGENYGWSVFEGSQRFRAGTAAGHVGPVYDYPRRGDHCAVTGGHVYRGDSIPGLVGAYVFGDYCSGFIWGLFRAGDSWTAATLLDTSLSISSFGEDAEGEILVVDREGSLHRLVAG